MDKLIQIIRRFDNYKIRHIDVLNNQESTSRETRLYQQIQKGKINSDDEASRFLFGKDAHKGLAKYRTFKAVFKKRVLNTLLFIDGTNPDLDEYQQATYEINREWMGIRTIFKNNMSAVAIPLAEQLLFDVFKYEYAEVAVPLINCLKYGIAMRGDKKQYAKYQNLYNLYLDMWLAEQKASEYHDLLRMEYVKTAECKPYMADIARAYFEELKPYMDKHNSAVLHTWGRSIEIYMYSTISDYKNLLDVAERAVAFFYAKPYEIKTPVSIFLHQKMIALMMMRRYPEAIEAIEETLKLRVVGSFNWFKAQESKVSLLLRMHHFTEGYAIYKSVTTMPEFDKVLEGMNKEMWMLFNAYFHLLHKLGKAPHLPFNEEDKNFRIKHLLNNTPTFDSDKNGMHLALLILDICFSMSLRQQSDLIDRIEAIEKFLNRHTDKTDPSYRFNKFGRMLLEIPKSGFIRSVLEQRTEILLEDLKSVPYDFGESMYRSEPIGLEEMWGWLLDCYEDVQ